MLISICDAELVGKTLNEGRLRMHISDDYFGGELVGEREALRMMRESAIVNLAGERSVGMALENKMASERAVRKIQGVPFLMIYRF